MLILVTFVLLIVVLISMQFTEAKCNKLPQFQIHGACKQDQEEKTEGLRKMSLQIYYIKGAA